MEITKEAINDFRALLERDHPNQTFTDEEVFDVAFRIMSTVELISRFNVKAYEDQTIKKLE